MKKKLAIILVIIAIIIVLMALILSSIRKYELPSEKITEVTVQYHLNTVTIDDPDKVKELCNKINDAKFKLHNFETGKGWVYGVRCYNSSGKMIQSFTTVTNAIRTQDFLYTTSDKNFNFEFLSKLFENINE